MMRAYDLILKKREGMALTVDEINFLIKGYTEGKIPDYQMSAWAMAVYFKGMTPEEIADLTLAIVNSGEKADLSGIEGIKVDKHSTGGVGDKTTFVLAPLVAAAGAPVAKMSGRGLGHTGGTIDKLESIPGFNTALSREDFIKQVNDIKVAVVGQTGNLTPADKKLYALRDVTATVDSIPLIASSVMSKKIAGGADTIVLDVKTGSGAFMKDRDQAFELAETMVKIGQLVGRETIALVTDMDQPLGFAVGNALEVAEAVDTLKGHGPADLRELSLILGSYMLKLAHIEENLNKAREKLSHLIDNGSGLAKLKEMVNAQGGNPRVIDDTALLPKAGQIIEVNAPVDGYVTHIDAEAIGISAMMLGAGRETKEDKIDLSVGVVLKKKVGDKVNKGEPLALLHANDHDKASRAWEKLLKAYSFDDLPPSPRKLVYGVVTKSGTERL